MLDCPILTVKVKKAGLRWERNAKFEYHYVPCTIEVDVPLDEYLKTHTTLKPKKE